MPNDSEATMQETPPPDVALDAVAEDQPGEEAVEQSPEPEGAAPETPPEPTEPDAGAELWDSTIPDLPRDELTSPEARERFLLKRLAAQPTAEAAKAGAGEPGPEGDSKSRQAAAPPIPELPRLTADEMDAHLQTAESQLAAELGEKEASLVIQTMRPVVDYATKMVAVAHAVIVDQGKQLDALQKEVRGVTVPAKLREAAPKVRGATDKDHAAAQRILDSGVATTPRAALILAVADREAEVADASKGGRKASEDAKVKAAAIDAARASGASPQGGDVDSVIPEGQSGYIAMLKRDEARAGKK